MPECELHKRPRYLPNTEAIGQRFPAVDPRASLSWFEIFKDDEFVKISSHRYKPTTSCSVAEYLIPDYMLERVN